MTELVISELQNCSKTHNVTFKAPEDTEKIRWEECVYCFDTPFNPDGLFISLTDYVGVCAAHIAKYVNKTSNRIFLNIWKCKLPPAPEAVDRTTKIHSEHTLRLYPHVEVPVEISSPQLDPVLFRICDQIISRIFGEQMESEREERPISMAANDLVQIKYNGAPISYDAWVCSFPDCGLNENLWLNLSDGIICCGRFVGGQKGNGHARKHFKKTGFPLVVKLGTIDNGDGDLYSYSDDSAVRDPKLKEHLAHFGLDIDKFKKTVKTTTKPELDANMKQEFSAIQEEGTELENVYGPGFTGLINMGLTCYLNSAIQMLYNVSDFLRVYGQDSEEIVDRLPPAQTYDDFNCQLAKVIGAMLNGQYSKEENAASENNNNENGIRPAVFRQLVGLGHPEFGKKFEQQDAEEFIRYLFDKIDENKTQGAVNPVDALRFLRADRFVDLQSGHVRYSSREETILSVPIPREKFRSSSIVVDGVSVKRPVISLEECISAGLSDDLIEGYTSPVTNQRGIANKQYRMGTFPDYLIIQLKRFKVDQITQQVRKIEIDVEVADQIDLTGFRGSTELQPGEQPLPDTDKNDGQNGGGKESAEQKENIAKLFRIGFTLHQAKFALVRNGWDAGLAADWLFNHVDEVPPVKSQKKTNSQSAADKEMRDGSSGKYQLLAFISHIGATQNSGHYIAHAKRDNGTWYIFNDEKVAISQNPPKSLGYLYLFKRVDDIAPLHQAQQQIGTNQIVPEQQSSLVKERESIMVKKEEIIELMETGETIEEKKETPEEKEACEKAEKEQRELEKAKEKFEKDKKERKASLERHDAQIPKEPGIFVYPSRTSESGKFDLKTMSVHSLLDYRLEDSKEESFQGMEVKTEPSDQAMETMKIYIEMNQQFGQLLQKSFGEMKKEVTELLPNSINRSELNLSHIQVSTKMGSDESATNAFTLNKQKGKTTKTSFAGVNASSNPPHRAKNLSPLSSLMSKQKPADRTNQNKSSTNFNKTHSSTSKTPPFISGNRYAIYFGFRRLGVNSEEVLTIHNVHPDGERLRIRCWVKGANSNNGTRFKVAYPQEKNRILDWDSFQKVVISFTPDALDHFLNFLYVECQSRHVMQKFKFLLHGFGGSAIVQPNLEDRSNSSMFLSANGRHQLLVNSLSKFRFWLHNQGNRCAFASIFIYGRRGELLPNRDTIVNTRNVILDKNNQGEFKRVIEIRYLGTRSNQSTPRPSSQSSVAFGSTADGLATVREEPPMQIIVFWGEERQRQRLKQFEKKLCSQLLTFGRNFTKMLDFYGEGEQWKQGNVEKYTSEEEFYYFDRNVKLIIIDVHEKKPFERSMTPINSANSTNIGQHQPQPPQRRTGSTLSVVSSNVAGGGRIYLPDQVVVEVDPDNTLLPGANEEGDDTLI